ncbi:MAG: hypothetical protein R3Y35_03455 [Clostridia bacterium]
MREIQNEAKYYMENKVFGAYETTEIVDDKFTDSKLQKYQGKCYSHRYMDIDGKGYRIHSVFPTDNLVAIDDKMLQIIDNDYSK